MEFPELIFFVMVFLLNAEAIIVFGFNDLVHRSQGGTRGADHL